MKKIDEKKVAHLYLIAKKTQREIGAIFSVSHMTIGNLMKKYNIKARLPCFYIAKKELQNLYINKKMSQRKIADIFRTSSPTIGRRLNEYRIKLWKKGENLRNENSLSWKGNNAGISACHWRLKKIKGRPQKCDICKTRDKNKFFEWANLSRNYFNFNDYKRMCKSCHSKYDKKYLNFYARKGI